MTFTESENKMIAEWLGICWHEISEETLSCGLCGESKEYILSEPYAELHPDFSHRDAFWTILENGPSNPKWSEFLRWSKVGKLYLLEWSEYSKAFNERWAIKQDFIGPKLAKELLRFVKEGKG